ncbi:MAG TPA: SWIM zinc finger family protein [Burkholderiaceae bacterium]|nr:SWIM zinc finger family protein [Burkholderiaceae bacterium]
MRAEVRGTAPAPYQLEVEIGEDPVSPGAVLTGQCSCPVGYNCKHAAAALIAHFGLLPPAPAREAAPRFLLGTAGEAPAAGGGSRNAAASAHRELINRLRALAEPASAPPPRTRQLLFSIALGGRKYLTVDLLTAPVLKDGRWGRAESGRTNLHTLVTAPPAHIDFSRAACSMKTPPSARR